MGLEIIAAGTGLFAGATGIPQYFEQKKAGRRAAREQEKANKTSQAAAQVENARRRRQAIAQARVAQAQNQVGMGSAVQSSSTLQGVQSSIGSQLGANIGAQNQRITSQRQIQGFQQNAADALRRGQERTAMWDAAGQTAMLAVNAFSGGASFGGGQAAGAGANAWSANTPGPRGAGGFR